MAWELVACLQSLRNEFDRLGPNRDRTSEGTIGDGGHSQNSSDHNPDETGRTPTEDADSRNEVHAIDVDNTGPWPDGWSMERCVQVIVLRHRNGRDDRLQNVIYNRRIWSRSWGWTARAYTGSNPHDKHAHFSARYTTAQENDTRPWGLLPAATPAKTLAEELEMELATKYTLSDLAASVLGKPKGYQATVEETLELLLIHAARGAKNSAANAQALAGLTGKDFTDEQAIVTGVLAGLDAEAIAAAIPQDIAEQVADKLHARLAS